MLVKLELSGACHCDSNERSAQRSATRRDAQCVALFCGGVQPRGTSNVVTDQKLIARLVRAHLPFEAGGWQAGRVSGDCRKASGKCVERAPRERRFHAETLGQSPQSRAFFASPERHLTSSLANLNLSSATHGQLTAKRDKRVSAAPEQAQMDQKQRDALQTPDSSGTQQLAI